MRRLFLFDKIRHGFLNLDSFVEMGRRKRQNKRNPLPYKNERNYSQTTKDNALFLKYYSIPSSGSGSHAIVWTHEHTLAAMGSAALAAAVPYQGLGMMPESELQDFYNRMKEPLPVTFRITGYKSQASELLKIIRSQFFNNLMNASASATSVSSSATSCTDGAGDAPSETRVAPGTDGAGDAPSETRVAPGTDGAGDAPSETRVAPGTDGKSPNAAGGGGSAEGTSPATGDGSAPGAEGDGEVSKGLTKEDIKPPKCLTWYPDELAWQLDLSRKAVRSQEILSKLHEFLVSETETGNISRQEAVSMIPPLVLDVQPDSKVLDMCAAPGSKTAQLIEYLHKDENSVPEGFVVANDKENKRCYLMVHQVKRLASPCCTIVNHDAAIFPKLRCSMDNEKPEFMLFDRVLADVPCSGDGTMRKNIDIWSKWQPTMGNPLHGLQLKILKRGLELLEVGGRLVYSTCSMHPVEDEAVIADMLRRCQGAVELVDISPYLPGFKTVPGLSHWKLMNKMGNWMEDFDSIPNSFKQIFSKSMFPPTAEEAKKFNLHLCHRVLPHHQDTGGFFVAALRKVRHLPWSREAHTEREEAANAEAADATSRDRATETADGGAGVTNGNSKKRRGETEEGPQPKRRDLRGYREDPFLFLQPHDPIWPPIRDFYGLTDEFPSNQLLYRSEQGAKRSLYFVSKAIRQLVNCNEGRVRFINMGVKFVSRSPSPLVPECDFRVTQECMGSLREMFTKRKISISREDAVTIFKEENPYLSKMSETTQKALEDISPGSVIFVYQPTESNPEPACEVTFCGWRGKTSVRSFVPRYERSHCLRLFGEDLAQLNAEVAAMKARRELERAKAAATLADEQSAPPLEDDGEDTPMVDGEDTPMVDVEDTPEVEGEDRAVVEEEEAAEEGDKEGGGGGRSRMGLGDGGGGS